MQKEEVKIGDKVYVMRELLAKEADEIDFKDFKSAAKKQIQITTGMSDAEYEALTFKERNLLITKCNELNGVGKDFQKTEVSKQI